MSGSNAPKSVIRVICEKSGRQIRGGVFAGKSETDLQFAGRLVMRSDHFERFLDLLRTANLDGCDLQIMEREQR